MEFAAGQLIWCGVLWDGFATIVLPRTVAPMRRMSGRFYRWSWLLWAAVGRRIRQPGLRLSFLAVYVPLSAVLLLVLWAVLMIVAFTLIYHGLGSRFHAVAGSVGFGTLLYMRASTFLTLRLGDVTSPDTITRLFILLEAGSGYIFLALIITCMPVLEQACGAREGGNSLLHSRAGRPPSAMKLLHRYSRTDRSEILRGNLREAKRWMAEILQSHLSHPVLTFYRVRHWGHSWLDVGVVRSPLGVAETGAVWLTQGELIVSALGVLSQHLVVLLDPAAIVATMHDAYGRIDLAASPYGVFMAGPSATGDIEGVIIHGARGARSLTVLLLAPALG